MLLVQFITVVRVSVPIPRQVPDVCAQKVEVPPVQFFVVVDVSVLMQRQVPDVCAQKVEVPQVQFFVVVDVSVLMQRQVPDVCVQTLEVPQVCFRFAEVALCPNHPRYDSAFSLCTPRTRDKRRDGS